MAAGPWQADGGARHLAYAADHAALADAFTRLAEASGDPRQARGGRHRRPRHDRAVLGRRQRRAVHHRQRRRGAGDPPEGPADNATPAANSLAAVAFLRLGALVGDTSLADRAVDILRSPAARRADPTAFAHLLAAAADLLAEARHRDRHRRRPRRPAGRGALGVAPPRRRRLGTPGSSPLGGPGRHPRRAAYVCRNGARGDLPASHLDELTAQLTSTP
ncbi:MAG: hypothetical protein R2699_13965 [Acidimicrobiales bacterium]